MVGKREFEAGLGRFVLWNLCYALIGGAAFAAAFFLLGVMGTESLARLGVGAMVGVAAGWLGSNAVERTWDRRAGDVPD